MRGYVAQTRFVAGELDPRMHMQYDSEFYQFGAAKITNGVVTQQGTIKRRMATEFIDSYAGTFARVIPLQLSPSSPAGSPFPVVISDNGTMYIEGSLSATIGPVINPNASFDLGATDWTSTGSGTIAYVGGKANITASTTVGQDRILYQSLIFADAGEYLIKTVATASSDPSPLDSMITTVGTSAGASDITLEYFDGSYLKFTVAAPSTTLYFGVKVFGGLYRDTPDDGGTITGTQTVSIDSIEVRKRSVATSGSSISHPYNAEDIKALNYSMVPSQNAMYLVTPKKPPMKLYYDTGTSSWLLSVITFTSTPTEWTTNNYPRCMCFFQGRSWWGGVESHPETVWGSKSLAFENLTLGANADDAIKFTNSAKGRIEWMVGVRNLLVGTEFGEFIVTSQSGVIQPSDLAIAPQSADGGSSVMPLPIGSAAMFIAADRKRIRTAQYTWTDESWVTRDATNQSEHLFDSGIMELAFARNPDNLLVCVLADGSVAIATVVSFNQPLAWTNHNIGNRAISACVLQENGSSTVYLVTYRSSGLALERMSAGPALDSRVAKSSTSAFSTVTGLANLAGLTVDAQLDGFYYDSLTVDGSGNLTLPISCKEAYVGIPYTTTVKTLRRDVQLAAGSTASLRKNSGYVSLWILESARPTINGVKTLSRTPEMVIDTPTPLFTGMVDYSLGGYNHGDLEIKSFGPYPLELCGVFIKTEGSTL